MESIPYNALMEVSTEDMMKVRMYFALGDTITIQKNVKLIKEWAKKQEHLIEAFQYLNSNVIERLYVLAKGSVELTKIKIDKMFTTRGMIADLVLHRSCEEFDKCWENILYVPLPKLNPNDQTRCTVGKIVRGNYDEFPILTLLRYCTMVAEFRIFLDYMRGDTIILDLEKINISILTKLNPFILKKAEILHTEVYDIKIKGIYFINAPPFLDKILSLVKPFLKEKIIKRLHILSSYEELHKEIPKEILPEDYGGDQPSLATLSDKWKNFFQSDEGETLINHLNKMTSDESKRNCFKFNEEYLGMPGSFRQLTLD